jgi:lipoprotein-anchoring transpeptidase ErfK/SrfK
MIDIKLILSQYINKNSNLNKEYVIVINITDQRLIVYKNYKEIIKYTISTSKYGEGSEEGSNKTPLGAHYIKEHIGNNEDPLTIFRNRIPTNIKTKIITEKISTDKDIICSRILWLDGLEEDKNKGSNIDSFSRYIYIHGTNEEGLLGEKSSHGCIRMSNSDIINLCDKNIRNTLVYISN